MALPLIYIVSNPIAIRFSFIYNWISFFFFVFIFERTPRQIYSYDRHRDHLENKDRFYLKKTGRSLYVRLAVLRAIRRRVVITSSI